MFTEKVYIERQDIADGLSGRQEKLATATQWVW
jgi:hypothetical protein